jgi:hypothetical protein
MMRGLGFLVGVALTVALFLLLVEGMDRPVGDPPPGAAASANAADPSLAPPPADTALVPEGESLPEEDSGDTPAPDPKPGFERPSAATSSPELPEPPVAGRYLFWSAFRSEWAARGFATRLTNATAVPVEVIEEGRGEYRVGFDYRDEAQRRERVARIETITGLELE